MVNKWKNEWQHFLLRASTVWSKWWIPVHDLINRHQCSTVHSDLARDIEVLFLLVFLCDHSTDPEAQELTESHGLHVEKCRKCIIFHQAASWEHTHRHTFLLFTSENIDFVHVFYELRSIKKQNKDNCSSKSVFLWRCSSLVLNTTKNKSKTEISGFK